MLLLLNWNLYKWTTTSIVWCVKFIGRGVFIGVPGVVTDLVKSVTHQVLAGQASHMAGWPSSVASTDSRPQVPFHRLLEMVTAKETHRRLQHGVGRLPTGSTHQLLCTWPPCVRCIPAVTLILVEFLISL
jgi:hypothetical protein